MATLETQLPHISPEYISKHEIWYRAIKSITTKRKDLVSKYAINRENMLKQAKEELAVYRESHKNEIIREQQIKEHERQRTFLHLKLDELRLSKQIIQGYLIYLYIFYSNLNNNIIIIIIIKKVNCLKKKRKE
jgi:hypothetical protein